MAYNDVICLYKLCLQSVVQTWQSLLLCISTVFGIRLHENNAGVRENDWESYDEHVI